jgi:hypothetical protein
MRAGADGCEWALRAAAMLGDWGTREGFEQGNSGRHLERAARERGGGASTP